MGGLNPAPVLGCDPTAHVIAVKDNSKPTTMRDSGERLLLDSITAMETKLNESHENFSGSNKPKN